MDLHAALRKKFLKERRPEMYRELKKAGQLEAHCTQKSREAAVRKADLMRGGMLDFEADEVVREGILLS